MTLACARHRLAGMLGTLLFIGTVMADDPELGNAWEDPRNPIRILFRGERLDLWSLQAIRRPALPSDPEGSHHPIDAMLEAGWRKQGFEGAPVMDRAEWLQRASLDLTGLRATHDEVQAFVTDESPDAYERVIDRLLASPGFGEHSARQWLDVVRYSDSNGFDWDEFRKKAWRYRDWVVRAINGDMPFHRFITMQLAGDELLDGPPRDQQEQDCLIATGYLRLGPFDNAAKLFNEQDRARVEVLTDLTETTASALLGLTMSCCRCHDHKTDPLSQADHYRLRAFFAATRFEDELPIDLQETQQEIESLKKQLRSPETGLIMTDDPSAIDAIHVLYQGDHRSKREVVEPGFPSVLFPNPPRIQPIREGKSTGRRLALARWICSAENPWTARVAVNRLWQQLFGQGIVATPNDFGMTGATPTHPDLLDYLATELIESGWSIKRMIRQIAISEAYRRVAVPGGELVDGDGSKRWTSMRTNLRRLSAEQFRDCVLQVSDLMQHRAGGPPVWPKLSDEILQANPAVLDDNETKTKGWYPSADSDQSVRSVYLVQKRGLKLPWMETFDQPENTVSCPKRETSIVASQALSLMNGELASQGAMALSQSLSAESVDTEGIGDDRFIVALFQRILSRQPTQEERQKCGQFLEHRSRTSLALVLLNSNEFAFIP
jgi:hypothetical protein